MAVYSIKDLEKISGIKAHTIRIWERRYKIIQPHRTPTNIRFYTDEDLKRILNISILNQNGFKISKIAELSDHQIKERILDLCLDTKNDDVQIENLVVSMLDLDEGKFINILSNIIIKQGFEGAVENILFPFLNRIGIFWQAGSINPAQEHFISNLIRQKLIVAIDNEMQTISANKGRIIFFLHEHEQHELSLLFYSMIARKEGYEVIYLGAAVPIEDLSKIEKIRNAKAFFTAFTSPIGKKNLLEMLNTLSSDFPEAKFYLSGSQLNESKINIPNQYLLIENAASFKQNLRGEI